MIIKRMFFSMCFLALVASCTSMNTSKDTPPKVGDVYGHVNQRTPSQASRTYWEPDSRTLTIKPGGGRSELNLTPSELESYTEPYCYTCPKLTWGQSTCQDYICAGGAGKSELWNAYYNA